MARVSGSERGLQNVGRNEIRQNRRNSLINKKKTPQNEVSYMGSERIELPTFWV